jgi:ABC-type nitrate/sulfonate/bicarbonate transport system substrate-binding protein
MLAGKLRTKNPEPIGNEMFVKIKIALLAVLLAFAAKPRATIAQTIKLNVAYPTTVGSMAVLWVTKEGRLFEKHGLQVELIYIGGSSKVVQAMLAREIPIAEIAIPAVIQANLALTW